MYKRQAWVEAQQSAAFEVFNLGECDSITVNELVENLAKVMDKRADIQYLPDMPGDVKQTYADIAKAKEVLGYAPKTKIQDGLKKYIQWLKT